MFIEEFLFSAHVELARVGRYAFSNWTEMLADTSNPSDGRAFYETYGHSHRRRNFARILNHLVQQLHGLFRHEIEGLVYGC